MNTEEIGEALERAESHEEGFDWAMSNGWELITEVERLRAVNAELQSRVEFLAKRIEGLEK